MIRDTELDALAKKCAQHAKFGAHCVATLPEIMKLIDELKKSYEIQKAADQVVAHTEDFLSIGHAISNEDGLVIDSISFYRSLKDK